MLCLKCGHENQLDPNCTKCGFFLGYLADSRGFMPQLFGFKEGLEDGTVTHEQVVEALQRLDQALHAMTLNVDQTGAALASLELDETQRGVLGGFMSPMRQAMENFQQMAMSLEQEEDIPQETLDKLEEMQVAISRGSEGVAYLIQTLHGILLEKVAGGEVLEPMPAQPQGE